MKELIGKTVQIYPGDTYSKQGKILEITDQGILFLIVDAKENDTCYKPGTKHFILFSARLTFRVI